MIPTILVVHFTHPLQEMDESLLIHLQNRLRSSERVKLAFDVEVDPPTVDDASSVPLSQDSRAKKLLALVCHEDAQDDMETGW